MKRLIIIKSLLLSTNPSLTLSCASWEERLTKAVDSGNLEKPLLYRVLTKKQSPVKAKENLLAPLLQNKNESLAQGSLKIHDALLMGDLALCKTEIAEAIKSGLEVNAKDENGLTLMHIAACSKSANSLVNIEALLDAGADPLIQDEKGLTPLHLAFICHSSQNTGHLI